MRDREAYTQYRTIKGYIQSSLVDRGSDLYEVCIITIQDTDERIQAIAAARIYEDHIYLSALLSAPWNLRLSSNVSGNMDKRVKGAGKAAFAATFLLAQKLEKAHFGNISNSRSSFFL